MNDESTSAKVTQRRQCDQDEAPGSSVLPELELVENPAFHDKSNAERSPGDDRIDRAVAASGAGDLDPLEALRDMLVSHGKNEGACAIRAPTTKSERSAEPAADATNAPGGLDALASKSAADEQLLLDLAARELPLSHSLRLLELQLAVQIGAVLDRPEAAFALARTLREVTGTSSAVVRRIQSALGTASNLRAQRRMLRRSDDL